MQNEEAAWGIIASARPHSGVLGLVRGRMKRQAFNDPPLPDREGEIQRIYQLQKDVSDYRQPEPAAPTTNIAKPKSKTRPRRK